MIQYSIEELEEVCAFMQPVAASVRIAKLFRNEGESGDTSDGDSQQSQTPADPFAGIDLDSLPDEVREKVEGARTQFANLQTEAATAKAQREAFEARSRAFQSEADRAKSLLQKHGLDPSQQQQQQQQQSPQQQMEAELYEQYKAAGVDEPNAKAWAKMGAIQGSVLQKRVLSEVGTGIAPHLQNVGIMVVDRLLEAAANSQEFSAYLQDEKVYNSVRGYMATLAKNNAPVDENTLSTTIKMVVGEHLMKGTQFNMQNQHQDTSRTVMGGSRGFGSAGFHGNPSFPNGGTGNQPRPANEETAKAINAVTDAMRRGMKVRSK